MRWLWLVALLVPAPAGAYGLGAAKDRRLGEAVERAANYLVRSRLPSGGWAWQRAEGKEAPNYGGIVAESLLATYEQTGQSVYLEAAQDYAETLVRRHLRDRQALPFKPDIELLVRITEATGEPRYADVARTWFELVPRRAPSGEAEVRRILAGRPKSPDLVGYDIALGIRAALAAEQFDYAHDLAAAALALRPEWLRSPNKTFGTISRAALLDALVTLDVRRYKSSIKELSRALLAEQTENGSWCVNETQASAYAVRALVRVGDRSAKRAAKRGAAWLLGTLLADGSWAHFNDGLPPPFVGDHISEIQAEALTAVILASKL